MYSFTKTGCFSPGCKFNHKALRVLPLSNVGQFQATRFASGGRLNNMEFVYESWKLGIIFDLIRLGAKKW